MKTGFAQRHNSPPLGTCLFFVFVATNLEIWHRQAKNSYTGRHIQKKTSKIFFVPKLRLNSGSTQVYIPCLKVAQRSLLLCSYTLLSIHHNIFTYCARGGLGVIDSFSELFRMVPVGHGVDMFFFEFFFCIDNIRDSIILYTHVMKKTADRRQEMTTNCVKSKKPENMPVPFSD